MFSCRGICICGIPGWKEILDDLMREQTINVNVHIFQILQIFKTVKILIYGNFEKKTKIKIFNYFVLKFSEFSFFFIGLLKGHSSHIIKQL